MLRLMCCAGWGFFSLAAPGCASGRLAIPAPEACVAPPSVLAAGILRPSDCSTSGEVMACVYDTPPISSLGIECQYLAVRPSCGTDWVIFQATCVMPSPEVVPHEKPATPASYAH